MPGKRCDLHRQNKMGRGGGRRLSPSERWRLSRNLRKVMIQGRGVKAEDRAGIGCEEEEEDWRDAILRKQ